MRLRILLFVGLGLVGLVVAGLVAALATLNGERLKGPVAEAVERATGRALTVTGPIDLALFPRPRLEVAGVRLANAPWGSRTDMVAIERLSAEVAWWPLIMQRRLSVLRLAASGVDLLLETDAEGRRNWDLRSATAPDGEVEPGSGTVAGEDRGLAIDTLTLENVAFAYLDGAEGRRHEGRLARAGLSLTGGRLAVRAEGTLAGLALALTGSLEAPEGLLPPVGAAAVNLAITLPETEARVTGRIGDLGAGGGLDLALSMETLRLSALEPLAGRALPAQPLRLEARLAGDPREVLRVEGLRAALGRSDIAGTLVLQRGGERPRLDAALAAERIALGDLAAAEVASPAAPPPAAGAEERRLFGMAPLPLGWLRQMDADVGLSIGAVEDAVSPVTALTLRAVLRDGALVVRPFGFTLAGSHVAGDASVDAAAEPPAFGLDLAAQQLDLGQLLSRFAGSDVLAGHGDLVLALHGRGATAQAVAAALDGRASLVMGHGTLAGTWRESPWLAALRATQPAAQRLADSRINCAIARFDIARGVATARTLVLDAGDLSVLGSGSVNLGSEALALDLVARARVGGIGGIAVPVPVRGTILAPTYPQLGRAGRPPLAALGGIVLDPGATRANPCAGLADRPAPSDPAPAPVPAPGAAPGGAAPGGATGGLPDLGGALRRLLR